MKYEKLNVWNNARRLDIESDRYIDERAKLCIENIERIQNIFAKKGKR